MSASLQSDRRHEEPARGGAAVGDRGLTAALAALGLGPFVVLVAMVALMGVLSPYFLTEQNVTNLLSETSVIALLGLGQLFVLLTRGIDLSVGSMIAFAGVLGAIACDRHGSPAAIVILIMLAVPAAIGFVNGFAFIVGKLPHPFIITFGTLSIVRGLADIVANGAAIPGTPAVITTIGTAQVGIVPVSAIVVVALALVEGLTLAFTRWGRWLYAIGGNPEAARRTGIPVNRILISTYTIGALLVGVAAIITMGQIGAGDPNAGQSQEFDAVASCCIGGVSFLGGRGHVGHVLVGALTIGVIRNGMDLLNISAFWQLVTLGTVTVAAVALDVQRERLVTRLKVVRSRRMGLAS